MGYGMGLGHELGYGLWYVLGCATCVRVWFTV